MKLLGTAKKSPIWPQKKQEKLKRPLSTKDVQVHFSYFSFISVLASYLTKNLYFGVAELSPPLEPYNPDTDLALKGTLDEIRIANAAIDEAVERLLNEAAERVLKEDDQTV